MSGDAVRSLLRDCREALMVAISDAVSLPGFGPAEHHLVRRIDACLATPQAAPADALVAARVQALEEAARIVESVNNYDNPMTAGDCSAAIRDLIARAAPVVQEPVADRVCAILREAVSGRSERYMLDGRFVRWGLVEKDIRALFAHPPVTTDGGGE